LRALALAAVGLVACDPKPTTRDGAPATATSPVAAAASTPEQVVEAIYASASANAGGDARTPLTDDTLRVRWFAADLAAALKRDQDTAVARGEVGALDFDPISASQDPSYEGLTVTAGPASTDRAQVAAAFRTVDGQPVRLEYTLTQDQGAWRVAEIAKPGADGWSLRQILALPPLER
jgi:hypothetical protein